MHLNRFLTFTMFILAAALTMGATDDGLKPFSNELDMRLQPIPAGSFLMGSSEEELAMARENQPSWWSDEDSARNLGVEQPQHKVIITNPFWMSATEVTVGQFREFIDATGYIPEPIRDGKGGMYYSGGKQEGPQFTWENPADGYNVSEKHPVSQITYADALAFCAWLSEQDEYTYSLPSEAQWEYAAKAGTQTIWPWGDSLKEADPYITWKKRWPQPVASGSPNPWGLYDMVGNLWELCLDKFDPNAYSDAERTDPLILEPNQNSNIRRGGTYSMSGPTQLRPAFRKRQRINYRGLHVGFRVVAVRD